MDLSKLPDVVAVGLLAWAFVSVARHNHEPISHHWLTGWILIVIHFVGLMLYPGPGMLGQAAGIVSDLSLAWAGVLFMRASVPYRDERSSRIMFFLLLGAYGFLMCAVDLQAPKSVVASAAVLIAAGPLLLGLSSLRRFTHGLRWILVSINVALGVFALAVLHRPDFADLCLDALLFSVYLSCAVHFAYMTRRVTVGGLISTTGFFLWAIVFVVGPLMQVYFPTVHPESEVWNLPKYVVAIGMILVMFEDQIAHNKHLALHDELTGLPNRRLFQDRLTNALERARRTNTQTALLILDLDQFKQVNDTLGHHAGDSLLRSVAELISHRIRRSDTVARTGGDEFAIILDSPTTRTEALHVGHALLEKLNEPMRLKDGPVISVGASLGVAVFPEDAASGEALCIAADMRMYEHKRSQGDSTSPHGHKVHSRSKLQKERGMGIPQ